MPFSAKDFLEKLVPFRKSVWFRVFYLVFLGLITFALFRFLVYSPSTQCLALLLIPITIFIFPYWLGERSSKNFLINVIPVFVIALVLIAAQQTAVSTDPTPVYLEGIPTTSFPSNLTIYNGTVTPFKASGPAVFNFTVQIVGTGVNASQVSVAVNLTPYTNFGWGEPQSIPMTLDPAHANTNESAWYVAETTVGPTINLFNFYTTDSRGNHTETGLLLGPISAPALDYFGLWLYFVALSLLVPFSFYFVLIFMFWYTARMRRMRSRMVDTEAKRKAGPEGEAEKTAEAGTRGTAGKKPAGFTCTNCGADVTEDETKCPKCGAVFED